MKAPTCDVGTPFRNVEESTERTLAQDWPTKRRRPGLLATLRACARTQRAGRERGAEDCHCGADKQEVEWRPSRGHARPEDAVGVPALPAVQGPPLGLSQARQSSLDTKTSLLWQNAF